MTSNDDLTGEANYVYRGKQRLNGPRHADIAVSARTEGLLHVRRARPSAA